MIAIQKCHRCYQIHIIFSCRLYYSVALTREEKKKENENFVDHTNLISIYSKKQDEDEDEEENEESKSRF